MKAVSSASSSGKKSRRSNNEKQPAFARKYNPLSPPTTIQVRGLPVHFPFQPYKCQVDYMEKVMDALMNRQHALLESPTGTGKTLCLLCSALAWQRSEALKIAQESLSQPVVKVQTNVNSNNNNNNVPPPPRVPVIIYASRTHSQLSQVVRELRQTRYRPPHAVLASREQMCVNTKVKQPHSSAHDINHDCQRLGQEHKCKYRNGLENFVAPSNETIERSNNSITRIQPVMDMEELIAMGTSHKVCPFYYTRDKVTQAELVLVPYNYLFDKDARKSTLADIPWDNAVVIFDEAHNLESFASESASFDLTSVDIAGCVADVTRAYNYVETMPDLANNVKPDHLLRLKAIFLKIEDYLLNLPEQSAYTGEYMMDFLSKSAGINYANHVLLIEELRKVNDLLMDMRGTGVTRGSVRLEHFASCLKRVFGHSLEARCWAQASKFRVYVSPKSDGKSSTGRTISYWCFAPALVMEEILNLKIRSILVTSGTLSPLPSYSLELGVNFEHTLENPHIVRDDQIFVQVIGTGVSSKQLSSSYQRRQDGEYYVELGNTLVTLAKVVPAGMLVFFPSYSVMQECLERWGGPSSGKKAKSSDNNDKSKFFAKRTRKTQGSINQYAFPRTNISYFEVQGASNPWKRLLAAKAVVTEPRSSSDLPDAIAEFKRFLAMPKSSGCILMGVCRGKISEGIDFAHEQSRAVVITGLPFPPAFDPKVKMKREYLDGLRSSSASSGNNEGFAKAERNDAKLTGHEWYSQQAHRAVNQAVGRVIRNRSDYGAVLLLDSRFGQKQNQEGLSRWVRPYIKEDEGFGKALGSLISFYKNAKMNEETRSKADEAKVASAPKIEYETELVVNEIAYIKTHEGESQTQAEVTNYISSDKIIGRGNRTDSTVPLSQVIDGSSRLADKNVDRTSYDAVFQRPQALNKCVTEINPKEVAALFMKKMMTLFSPEQQSIVKKASVAMSKHVNDNDPTAYLDHVVSVVNIILECESFGTKIHDEEPTMLLLLFHMQPKAMRSDVESISFSLVCKSSTFGHMCKLHLSDMDFHLVCRRTASLLRDVWGDKSTKEPLSSGVFSSKVLSLLQDIQKTGLKLSSPVAKSFCKLFPQVHTNKIRAIIQELASRRDMERMKSAEKRNRGEDAINMSIFSQSQPAFGVLPPGLSDSMSGTANAKNQSTQSSTMSNPYASKSSPKQSTQSTQYTQSPGMSNPYASKSLQRQTKESMSQKETTTKPFTTSHSSTNSGLVNKQTVNLNALLDSLDSENGLDGLESSQLTQLQQSKIPKNLRCQVCDTDTFGVRASNRPHIAHCGHVACLECWLKWLKKSKTCPSCRQSVLKESLALAVFKNKV